jgi:hypothetical protein
MEDDWIARLRNFLKSEMSDADKHWAAIRLAEDLPKSKAVRNEASVLLSEAIAAKKRWLERAISAAYLGELRSRAKALWKWSSDNTPPDELSLSEVISGVYLPSEIKLLADSIEATACVGYVAAYLLDVDGHKALNCVLIYHAKACARYVSLEVEDVIAASNELAERQYKIIAQCE